MTDKHVLVTGGAGYIGSLLVSELLRRDYRVTALDSLLFGGESLLAFYSHPNFRFVKADVVTDELASKLKDVLKDGWQKPEAVVHLAAIDGFPFCQAVGKDAAFKNNVEATKKVFSQAVDWGAERFIFTSTCNVYGPSSDSKPRTEASPLDPRSLYTETKIKAEEYLLEQGDSACAPLIFRLPTLYGISPRPRFDLVVNELVLDAHSRRKGWISEKGNLRSFIHVRDAVDGIIKGLEADVSTIRGEIYNLGTQNYKKHQVGPQVENISMMKKNIKDIDNLAELLKAYFPHANIEIEDRDYGGEMNDIEVSFKKIEQVLGFKGKFDVDDGVKEVKRMLDSEIVHCPYDGKYRNARPFLVQ